MNPEEWPRVFRHPYAGLDKTQATHGHDTSRVFSCERGEEPGCSEAPPMALLGESRQGVLW